MNPRNKYRCSKCNTCTAYLFGDNHDLCYSCNISVTFEEAAKLGNKKKNNKKKKLLQ